MFRLSEIFITAVSKNKLQQREPEKNNMTNAKQITESVDLNLDTDYLEIATVSLIREYLARKVRTYKFNF